MLASQSGARLMWARIERIWRWLVTIFSYFLFGIGGLVYTVIAVPVLFCLPGGQAVRVCRAQWLIHRLFKVYVRLISLIGVVTYQTDGVDKLRGARLIVANHPSLLDIVFLISLVPSANCVVKGKLTRNFFTRGPIKIAGYIMNEEATDVIEAAKRAMDDGQTLIIFPEGTRTDPSGKLIFRRGAANVAIRTGSAINPVLIYCSPAGLTKSQRWYQIPARRMHLRFMVMDQVPIDAYFRDPKPSRAARDLNLELIEYFEKELVTHG